MLDLKPLKIPWHHTRHRALATLHFDLAVLDIERGPSPNMSCTVVISAATPCTHQGACAHPLLAAVLPQRQGIEQPHFEGQLLEQSAAERVVRMIMRIDQSGQHQAAGCVYDLVISRRRKIGANRNDFTLFDQDIPQPQAS